MVSIPNGPHYEIPSTEFAAWLEKEAEGTWWNVDGDPLLTGRLSLPCPADELAAELRTLDRPLLVQANRNDSEAKGQPLKSAQISQTISTFAANLMTSARPPEWANDRVFYCCWKGSPYEWLLAEDSVTAKQAEEDKKAPVVK